MAQPIETNLEQNPVAFHVYKSLTGKIISSEPITPNTVIPFGEDFTTKTTIECDTDGTIEIVKRRIGLKNNDEFVSARIINKSIERLRLTGIAPREEIQFIKK